MGDINSVLAIIGQIMGAFAVPTDAGNAFLNFSEFWLVLLKGTIALFTKLFTGGFGK